MLSPLMVAAVFAAQASAIAPPPGVNGVAHEVASQSGSGVPPSDPAAGSDGGEIVVTALHHPTATDPLAHVNEKSFEATQAVDKAFVGPVALGYKHIVPKPVRLGIRNVLGNLHQPVVFVNFLLQGKPGKAGETAARFAINSTVGLGGVLDVAKRRPFNLPNRPNGFGDTLGFYGVRPGAYLYLPLIGPTTVRDLIGGTLDRLVLPMAVGKPFGQPAYTAPTGVVSALDHRAEFEQQLRDIRESDDPYLARRTLYLRKRQAEINGLHNYKQNQT